MKVQGGVGTRFQSGVCEPAAAVIRVGDVGAIWKRQLSNQWRSITAAVRIRVIKLTGRRPNAVETAAAVVLVTLLPGAATGKANAQIGPEALIVKVADRVIAPGTIFQ